MPINILMPALSPTMEKGNLARWLKKEGDKIKSGDVLAEIETDKATMEVEAVDEGVLAKIVVPDGTADVPVNDVIGMIAEEGEDSASVGAAPAKAMSNPAAQEDAPKATAAPPLQPALSSAPSPQKAAPSSAAHGHAGERLFASPLARRIAKQEGIDLTVIKGSGPHGRIIERDVKGAPAGSAKPAAAAAPKSAAPPATVQAVDTAAADEMVKKLFAAGSYEEVPHDNMRKTIARRLVEAKRSIPHFYLTVDCEIDALLKLREEINAAAPKSKDGKPGYKVSVNDMVIKALALAIVRVPGAAVTFTEGSMLHHKHADVSVAVAIPGGLITPVIRSADTLSLSGIANAMKDLAARAKERKLKPEEYQGGITAVSNLGMFGIKDFSAVINPPQSSIMAVGMGEKRAVVKGDQIVVATIMSATISCDHRALDGAKGAELIQEFKRLIESPLAMLV